MAFDHSFQRYRFLYAKLLRLYPKPYYDLFGEGMEQTFSDLYREQKEKNASMLHFVFWLFTETFSEILKENAKSILMHYKNFVAIALGTAFLLLIPLVAMQFSDDVVWTLFDFLFAGVSLLGFGFAFELISQKGGTLSYRVAVGAAALSTLFLIWANGAVGLIGSEDNPANMLYVAVLAVGLIGAVAARLEPVGMARTLFAMALTQAIVPVVALTVGRSLLSYDTEIVNVIQVIGVTAFFITLFVVSGALFQNATVAARTK